MARSCHGNAVGRYCSGRIAVIAQREGGSDDGRIASLVLADSCSGDDRHFCIHSPSVGDSGVLGLVAAGVSVVRSPALGVSATCVARSCHGNAVGGHCGGRITVVAQREGGGDDGRIASLVPADSGGGDGRLDGVDYGESCRVLRCAKVGVCNEDGDLVLLATVVGQCLCHCRDGIVDIVGVLAPDKVIGFGAACDVHGHGVGSLVGTAVCNVGRHGDVGYQRFRRSNGEG